MDTNATLSGLLAARDVAHVLAISERSLWRFVREGLVPPPVKLTPRTTRWRVDDIQRFLEALPVAGQGGEADASDQAAAVQAAN